MAARRVNISILRWNPLTPGYAGAAAVFILSFFLFGRTELHWAVALLSMAVGFAVGMGLKAWFTRDD